MRTVGIAIICKTPEAGRSKTRLSPPLSPAQCASISACFIRDLGQNIQALCDRRGFGGYAVYTPVGSEEKLRGIIPAKFDLIPQVDGDLGARLLQGIKDILAKGHDAAFIVSSDSPTLPMNMLEGAIDRLLHGDCVVLGQAIDGGYTFIGLRHPYERLFQDIAWSTDEVHRQTLERAREISLPVFNTSPWYDVDEASTLAILQDELRGGDLPFAPPGQDRMAAPATRSFLDALRGAEQVPGRGDTHADAPETVPETSAP